MTRSTNYQEHRRLRSMAGLCCLAPTLSFLVVIDLLDHLSQPPSPLSSIGSESLAATPTLGSLESARMAPLPDMRDTTTATAPLPLPCDRTPGNYPCQRE